MSVEMYDIIKECADIAEMKIGHRSPTNKHMKALLTMLRSSLDELVIIYEEVLPTHLDISDLLLAVRHVSAVEKKYKSKISKARKEYFDGRQAKSTGAKPAP